MVSPGAQALSLPTGLRHGARSLRYAPRMAETRGAAVVTGGGSGLGRQIALELAGLGHPVALLGRRQEILDEVLDDTGGEGLALACDVRDPAAVAAAAAAVEARFGP